MEVASAVSIARNAQILGIPDVCTELELMIAVDLRPVVNKLELLFVFDERAVATAYVETVAKAGNWSHIFKAWQS